MASACYGLIDGLQRRAEPASGAAKSGTSAMLSAERTASCALATMRDVAAFCDALAAQAQQREDEGGRFLEAVRAA